MSLFGYTITKKSKPVVFSDTKRIRVLFHRDTAGMQSHGAISASHVDYDLDNNPVRFSFLGMTTPPALTIETMEHIWQEAQSQGYMVHSLLSYGAVIEANPAEQVGDLIQRLAVNKALKPELTSS